jgi:putative restriction endonuclease
MNLINDGKVWTWEETLLAFDLYSKMQYSKISVKNEEVIALAELLGRKPGAVAKKMFNIAAHDPKQLERGVVALSHSNKFDKLIWEAFEEDSYQFAYETKEALAIRKNIPVDILVSNEIADVIIEIFPYGEDRDCATKARVGQYFFRTAVLTAYKQRCCVTGVAEPKLLIASHIKPWKVSDDKKEKTNPRNGLCLNALHDKAFDNGLITLSTKYDIIVSPRMREVDMDSDTCDWFMSYDKRQIELPEKFLPGKEFIEYHNDVVFRVN